MLDAGDDSQFDDISQYRCQAAIAAKKQAGCKGERRCRQD